MKHWGLQYQNRMESFTREFVGIRCEVNDSKWDVVRAEKTLSEFRAKLEQVTKLADSHEKAIRWLMQIGPHGLAVLEGESNSKEAMTVGEFNREIINRGGESRIAEWATQKSNGE